MAKAPAKKKPKPPIVVSAIQKVISIIYLDIKFLKPEDCRI